MPKRKVTNEERAATIATLENWLTELGSQKAVGDRLKLSQGAVSQALGGLVTTGMVDAVAAARTRVRAASSAIAALPVWINVDRLPPGFRAALEHDAFPTDHHAALEELARRKYAEQQGAPERWWIDEARRIAETLSGETLNQRVVRIAKKIGMLPELYEKPEKLAAYDRMASWDDDTLEEHLRGLDAIARKRLPRRPATSALKDEAKSLKGAPKQR